MTQLRWYLFGRDRRHPIAWLLAIGVVVAVGFVVAAFLPFVIGGLIVGTGAREVALRHPVPTWGLPLVAAGGLALAMLFPPSLLVSVGALGGLIVARRHGPSVLRPIR